MWTILAIKIARNADMTYPMVTYYYWMTECLQKTMADKRKVYKKFKLLQSTSDFDSYVNFKRTYEKVIRKKKPVRSKDESK